MKIQEASPVIRARLRIGAGNRTRTDTISLEGWDATITSYPQGVGERLAGPRVACFANSSKAQKLVMLELNSGHDSQPP
jgi:hypothetical protein